MTEENTTTVHKLIFGVCHLCGCLNGYLRKIHRIYVKRKQTPSNLVTSLHQSSLKGVQGLLPLVLHFF